MFNKKKITYVDWWVIAALVVFVLCFRLLTIMMINTGVDERDYWQSARAMTQGLPYPELSHRTTRFGVILPVAGAQVLLGVHPNVYYVLPILNCMVQVGLAYAVGLRLRGRLTGFLAALGLALFPYMIRAGSQVRPEIFSITYLLAAIYCLVNYLDSNNQRLRPLAWASAWLFLAYMTKITNLYFVPGFLFAIIYYKRRPLHAILLSGILFGLFLVETGLYATLTSYKLGQLAIITQKHFHADSFTVPRLIDLLGRFAPDKLQLYWSIPFVLFGLSSVIYLLNGKNNIIKALVFSAAGFFFFITIAVKSLNPIIPAESFINRYFSAVLVPVFLVLAYYIEGITHRFAKGRIKNLLSSPRAYIFILVSGLIGSVTLFSLPVFPERLREYAHSLLRPAEHPFSLNEKYRVSINQAWSEGTPIVAGPGNAGSNVAWTCAAYFLDLENFENGKAPSPRLVGFEGREYHILGTAKGLVAASRFIVARRAPFRLEETGPEGLDLLAKDDNE